MFYIDSDVQISRYERRRIAFVEGFSKWRTFKLCRSNTDCNAVSPSGRQNERQLSTQNGRSRTQKVQKHNKHLLLCNFRCFSSSCIKLGRQKTNGEERGGFGCPEDSYSGWTNINPRKLKSTFSKLRIAILSCWQEHL